MRFLSGVGGAVDDLLFEVALEVVLEGEGGDGLRRYVATEYDVDVTLASGLKQEIGELPCRE